jgi:hypothetical protein
VIARDPITLRAAVSTLCALCAVGWGWVARLEPSSGGAWVAGTAVILVGALALAQRRRIELAGDGIRVVGWLRARRYRVDQVRALRRRVILEPRGTEIEFDDGFIARFEPGWTDTNALLAALTCARASGPYREAAALVVVEAPIVLSPARPSGLRGAVGDLGLLLLFAAMLLVGVTVALLGWFEWRGAAGAAWCVAAVALLGVGVSAFVSVIFRRGRIQARGVLTLTREGMRVSSDGGRCIPWSEVDAVGAREVRLRDGTHIVVSGDEALVIHAAQTHYRTTTG